MTSPLSAVHEADSLENTTFCISCRTPLRPTSAHYFDTRFGHPPLYGITTCEKCGLEQTVPRPSAETLQSLYEAYYNFGGEHNTRYTRWRQWFLQSGFYTLWLLLDGDISFHSLKGSGRLLDVGCNEGRGLARLRGRGYEVDGLEFNSRAAAVARSAGFIVYECAIEDLQLGEPYDIIVMSNVLEHSLDPMKMLTAAHRLLKPGGRLYVSCPNSHSVARHLFGRYWINWHVPFHLIHFSSDSLYAILGKAGFRIEFRRQATPALWITQSVVSRLHAQKGVPTRKLHSSGLVIPLMFIMRGLLFPLLMLANLIRCGDCLMFCAVKDDKN